MLKRSSQLLAVCFLLGDLAVTAAAWFGAYALRFHSGWIPLWKAKPDVSLCWRDLPLVLVLAAVAYRLTGQYAIHRLRRFREEMVSVCKGAALLSLLVMAATFYLQDPYDSRVTMMLFIGVVLSSIQPAGVLPKGEFSGVVGSESNIWV